MRLHDSDLIDEARELWRARRGDPGDLPGIRSEERACGPFSLSEVEVLTPQGAEQVGKPAGLYLTLTLEALLHRRAAPFSAAVGAVAEQVERLLPPEAEQVLVVGLGNRAVTPDAVGPRTADTVLVTRHLVDRAPEVFGAFRPVSALAAGVLGNTGMESGEVVQAVVGALKPDAVIAVDALCARSVRRLGSTVQLSNTGIAPGSGVGSARFALTAETLGVPVVAVGVPTVVRAEVLAAQWGGQPEGQDDLASLLVTPKEIDALVADVSKLLGYGISMALQTGLRLDDLEALLS
ncbi:MAG: GPR endopeptidase [Clostridiales bacterium]|nr:GPR endopeptidase [Clostridiales bacterium]